MKTYKRTIRQSEAAQYEKNFRASGLYVKPFGVARVPRGVYNVRVVFMARVGGNEWSTPHLATMFELYY